MAKDCWSLKMQLIAVVLRLFLVLMAARAVSGTCEEDLYSVENSLSIQENTPADTVLLNITTDYTLEIVADERDLSPPLLKIEHGKLLTARDVVIDGEANKDFCEMAKAPIVKSIKCVNNDNPNRLVSRIFIFQIEFTDDYQTDFNFQPITIKEQAFSTLVIDLGDENVQKMFAWDKDCFSKVQLEIIETNDTRPYFRKEHLAIYTRKALDYERQQQYIFNVSAVVTSENSFNLGSFVEQLVINVEDVDDMNPVFDREVFSLTLLEDENDDERNASGPAISARDGDIGLNASLRYSIISSVPPLGASITEDRKLTVIGPIDREKDAFYKIIVKAQQEDNPLATATATVSLTIADINDNRPEFKAGQKVNAAIEETASAGTHVVWLQASDADDEENAMFEYVIHDDMGAFKITTDEVNNVAELVVKDSILLKGLESTIVKIRLVELHGAEGGDECDFMTSCAINITVAILDVNDNTPVFTKPQYSWNIYNDQEVDVTFGKIEATDVDRGKNAEVQYTLSKLSSDASPDCDKVQIATSTGELTLKQKMMSGVSCFFTASACDSPEDSRNKRCANSLVTVSVQESPSFNTSSEVLLYEAHIRENLEIGTKVLQLPKTGLVTDNTNFTIDGTMLKTARTLDREQQSIHIVSAGLRNGLQIKEMVRITVYVDNVNDNSPSFDSENYQIYLTDNDKAGLVVLNVSATDADSPDDNVTFSLLNMKDIFNIDTITGQVRLSVSTSEVAATVDMATASQRNYGLLVEARDSGMPPFKTTTNVQVHFTSTNKAASVMVPVRKDTLMKDKTAVERTLSELLGVSIQVLRIESIGGMEDLGSKIFIKQGSIDGLSFSNQELNNLIDKLQEAIHNAFAKNYNGDNTINDGGKPDNEDGAGDDDENLSVLTIVLICLVIVLFIMMLFVVVMFYQMRKRYRSELSLLQKLNKNTSIYDTAPLFTEASSTTNGSVQGTALHQNGSPRRDNINLVAYSNDAYAADDPEQDPTYSRIQETQAVGARHNHSTSYVNNRAVTGSTQTARNDARVTEQSTSPNAALSKEKQEESLYNNPRISGIISDKPSPVFKTTIDVVYPRLSTNGNTQNHNQPFTEGSLSPQPLNRNFPQEDNVDANRNWSFRRNSRLGLQQQSPTNTSVGPNERGDFDDIDIVSPASSRQRRGSMKAGSESDSGLPSDRDLPLDDETDMDAAIISQNGSSKGYNSIYPKILPTFEPRNSATNPASTQLQSNIDLTVPYEPEPDYNKRVRFDEAKRRGEMVELPQPGSLDINASGINIDSETTTL